MTQIPNVAADPSPPATQTSVTEAAPHQATAPTAATDPANLRLVIEDDQAAGCFVYKTIDWRTGQVVQQLPREQLLKLRETDAYLAGDVIKTEA